VAILLLWQIFSAIGFVRRNVLPPPSEVLSVWYDLITGATDAAARYSGTWLDHATASTWRVFAGFGWGVALGTFIGLLMYSGDGWKTGILDLFLAFSALLPFLSDTNFCRSDTVIVAQ